MSGPLNFNKIKKQMESDGYLRQWNLRAIEVSFKSKAITQEQRDKLIALLYSKGKSDKLKKHHIVSTYFDKIKKIMFSNFKSEIDWSKWNFEIPNNKELLNEYFNIEKKN
jgi:hypothetical protein